jgi:hypothetical protein
VANDGKLAVDLLRNAIGLLPKGPKQDELSALIARTNDALKRSEAAVAKDLGFHLCKCAFPPPIMLWRENEKAFVCPNPECGHREQPPQKAQGFFSMPLVRG